MAGFYSIDLNEERRKAGERETKNPFPHQLEAMAALSKTFDLGAEQGRGGLLVLPTGAGKTFTTVKWLCDNVLKRNTKVLWLAHSFYLLDQACQEFRGYACWMPEPRETMNIRVVSSTAYHDSVPDIELTDDVVIITTQTAIRSLDLDALDRTGTQLISKFRRFVEHGNQAGLFVVLDEAHHAPAYGCRNLLVGDKPPKLGIRMIVPRTNLLGLTATPTYADETRRGWLKRIFENEVIYKADRKKLTAQGILARPVYEPRSTGREVAMDDRLYNRLVREHKDLPEDIIGALASNVDRNAAIVREYTTNRKHYGKTIIFADRWYQCVYLKEKLAEAGIRADAVYSHIDADPGSAEARNQRTVTDNERIINAFKYGRRKGGRDELDVLINVRMLTEGTDVPSVRTVFLTRQTTSQILFTQMVGRALRGPKAGGAPEANIVMFMDDWKRLVTWATPATLDGGTDEGRPETRGFFPLEHISIQLVENLVSCINNPDLPTVPYDRIMPVGWYVTELVVADADSDETNSFTEFVMVYQHTKPKFEKLIRALRRKCPAGWEREVLEPEWIQPQIEEWIGRYFDPETDDIGNCLAADVERVARHVAQRLTAPEYHVFEERDQYDLDALARGWIHRSVADLKSDLEREFSRPGSLWKTFYKSFDRFFDACLHTCRVALRGSGGDSTGGIDTGVTRRRRELSEEEKRQVKRRDGNACLCCGAHGKGVRLQVDHIVSYEAGGPTSVENSQTLCSICNQAKGINEINYQQTSTLLRQPGALAFPSRHRKEDVTRTLRRLVNEFYHCGAVSDVRVHKRRNGRFYDRWEIELFAGNDPKWLSKEERRKLLRYVRDELGYSHVKAIRVIGGR